MHYASKHFDEVELVTDSVSWIEIEKLRLPFTSVKTTLDNIPDTFKGFWALGKLYAYAVQDKPFIHIDNDVILWEKLPDWALNAPLLVQQEETDG